MSGISDIVTRLGHEIHVKFLFRVPIQTISPYKFIQVSGVQKRKYEINETKHDAKTHTNPGNMAKAY